MAELIAFPDVEQGAVEDLAPLLDVPVGTKVPTPRPASFVRVQRTGGPAGFVVDHAQMTFEAWATTETAAFALIRIVRAQVLSMVRRDVSFDGCPVVRVEEIGGPGNLPDPVSNSPRYSMTAAVHVRGAVLDVVNVLP